MFSAWATAAWTLAFDMPPSTAAKSSPHGNSQAAAPASRAKASGSAINPRLKIRSVGVSKPGMTENYRESVCATKR